MTIEDGRRILAGRAKALSIVLLLFVTADLTLSVITAMGLLDQAATDPTAARIAIASGLAQFGCLVASAVTTSMWLYRANDNLRQTGATLAYGPNGAWAWYLVPVANLFKPFQAMKEIWDASLGASAEAAGNGQALLRLWWGCWIGGNILATLAQRLEDVNHAVAAVLGFGATASLAGSAWFLYRIVGEITEAQQARGQAAVFA